MHAFVSFTQLQAVPISFLTVVVSLIKVMSFCVNYVKFKAPKNRKICSSQS